MSTIRLAAGKCVSDKSLRMWAKSTAVWRSVTATCRQPSNGVKINEQMAFHCAHTHIMPCGCPGFTLIGICVSLISCFDVSSATTGTLDRAADDKPPAHLPCCYERRIGIRWDDPLSL